jgi:hypothetical protein
MIFSLALSLIAIASGTLLTYTFDEGAPLASRLASGACIGFAVMGLVGFVLASFLGLSPLSLVLTAAILGSALLVLRCQTCRNQFNTDIDQAIKAVSRASTKPDRWAFIYFLFYAGVFVVMWQVFDRAMFEKPAGLYTGVLNNYGDLPFHLSVITRFAFGQNYPPEDPTFAGARFTYPFLTDFISAMFVRAGASLRDSMFIENWIVGVGLVGVLHRFGQTLLRNRTAALLTPVLVILNGGFGWTMLFSDVNKTDSGVFQLLKNIPHSYTILPEVAHAWRWGNSVTSLLVPQRGFLLGIPLAVIVFTQWWMSVAEKRRQEKAGKAGTEGRKSRPPSKPDNSDASAGPFSVSFLRMPSVRRMVAAGIVAGLLPLIHAHSFIAVMLTASFLLPWTYRRGWGAYGMAAFVGLLVYLIALYYGAFSLTFAKFAVVFLALGVAVSLFWLMPCNHVRLWLCFFVLAFLIGGPQIFWSTRQSAVKIDSFIAWQFGWDSDQETFFGSKPVGPQPIDAAPPVQLWMRRVPYVAWFWFKNTGLFIPLLVAALLWKREDYLVSRTLLLFYFPFTLCFIIPNLVRLAPWVWDNIKILFYWWIATAPLVALLLARLWEGRAWNRVLAATLLVGLTLAGGLDVYALLSRQGEYQEFDRDGVSFAEQVKQQTDPRAMVLHAPVHNTPIFLTGRRSLMGYPGHIWTHGIDYGPRESDIKKIYSGSPEALGLLTKYGVNYVLVDPQEHSVMPVNDEFFSRFPEVANTGEYHLYKVAP